ncbi:MAG: 4-(cytidine 5'-diphospho)-2-C-methyl-D-erythritol kinase [Reyranellaceae bacterium]
MGRGIALKAPAKLNLGLRVLGRRADGYHLLQSLVVFLDLADEVTLAPALAWRLSLTGPFAAGLGAADNLALRAGRTLARHATEDLAGCAGLAADIVLAKHIPLAAGLGGGSADAAAVLRGLNELWRLHLPPQRLQEIAARLGADVPMCLAGVPAMAGGIGERIDPLPLPGLSLLLVNLGIPLATADVFARLAPPYAEALTPPEALRDVAAVAAFARALGNGLTAPAVALCPMVSAVLADIAAVPDCLLAQMSGSGTTCFGLFENDVAASAAAAHLRRARPSWFVRACRSAGG